MEYNLIVIDYNDPNFNNVCKILEQNIVLENLSKNGGTLNYTGLTYHSDILILATLGSEIVGFNSIVYTNNNGLYIYQIAVKKAHQQQGVGMLMMNKAMEIAQENNMTVSANVMDYNTNSKKMFERLGFSKLGYSEENNGYYEFKQDKKTIGSK